VGYVAHHLDGTTQQFNADLFVERTLGTNAVVRPSIDILGALLKTAGSL
jgi:hypothetical protein